eukprot:CAMPEP_0176130472 /NCGR_PEP_ID=MMETSP0120_2-20121206/66017_1 /TAXON_ID=160619 /ORGANISM="Kryptoperidinium foliaceum, Strain CCMP 1326" /LENGTH=66 /DNA_ID=CAMNT_0017465767 /DNA_START=425 /DNA_END=622 /DNA_ORIENTATION=+
MSRLQGLQEICNGCSAEAVFDLVSKLPPTISSTLWLAMAEGEGGGTSRLIFVAVSLPGEAKATAMP